MFRLTRTAQGCRCLLLVRTDLQHATSRKRASTAAHARNSDSFSSRRTPARAARMCRRPATPTISGLAPAFYVDATQERSRATTACGAMSRKSCRNSSLKLSGGCQAAVHSRHSMGGHGALTVALRHPDANRAASAFAPIVCRSQVPWGTKALGGFSAPTSKPGESMKPSP